MTWIEHVTSPLPRECSTTELHGQYFRLATWLSIHLRNLRIATATTHVHRTFAETEPSPNLHRTTGHTPIAASGAGEGNRTLVISLEGFCSTIELHPLSPTKSGGGGWIRTIVLVRGQIYSLLPLTTRPPHRKRTSNYGAYLAHGQEKMWLSRRGAQPPNSL